MKYLLVCILFVGAVYGSYRLGREAERADIHRKSENLARNLYLHRSGNIVSDEPKYSQFEQLRYSHYAAQLSSEPPLILFPAFFKKDPIDAPPADPDKLLFALKPIAYGDEVIIVNTRGTSDVVTTPMVEVMESQIPYMKDYLDSEKSR